jgi:hypothetical protein
VEPFRDDNYFAATLRSLRPMPRPTFAAELDERAAAGFGGRPSLGDSPLGHLVASLRALPPRRLVLSAGITALAAVVAATAVVSVSEPGSNSSSPAQLNALSGGVASSLAAQPRAGAASGGSAASSSRAAHDGGEETGPTPYESAVSGTAAAPAKTSGGSGAIGTAKVETAPSSTGPYASRVAQRDVEHSAQVVLGADPADVRKDAARVFEAVHTYNGIVLSSSIRDGGEGEAEAQFELLIPGARLGDALAAFSGIAEVRSRHQSTDDITAPTVRIGERLQDSRAKIEGLLEQLAGADTDAERAATEAELRTERRHAASLRSQLMTLQRRANLSRVSLQIETGAGSSGSSGDGSSWGVGDALGDAGHILAIAAGVIIVGLAVAVPLALIVLLAWLANRAWIRHRRERALG